MLEWWRNSGGVVEEWCKEWWCDGGVVVESCRKWWRSGEDRRESDGGGEGQAKLGSRE